MAARLSEIAGHAGVSLATASRVLNGRSGVSEAARRSVLAAVDVLGYERPAGLQSRSVGLIGVIVAELDNPIFPQFAQALERPMSSYGYSQLLVTRPLGLPAEKASIQLLQEHGVSGVIFISGLHSDSQIDVSHYVDLRKNGVPLAFINGNMPGFDATFVSDDDVVAMDMVVAHLVSLGHRHIGLATGPTRYVPAARKVQGFQDAMARHAPDGTGEEYVGDYTLESGRSAARDLIQRGCTAIATASDFMALGAIAGARSLGLTVPGDISVTGYDGSKIMGFVDPPLTTVKQPVERLATAAVRSLIEEIEGNPWARDELLFEPELIVRRSTGAAPRTT